MRAVRPGLGRFVGETDMKDLGYRTKRGGGFKVGDTFEAWQRLEYLAVMGRLPKLATAEEMAAWQRPVAS